ncbi:tetratricopeptide (TPR) repeat protein [Pedobacter sp. CAN_A7]|uniref:tetratricopeptide repeat protein n=1 Tax=Pedobacter sp. CAN_A7 TaxID=2787722 RepID=UPI0018C97299
MKKTFLLCSLLFFGTTMVNAQDIKDLYFDYMTTRMVESQNNETIRSAAALLNRASELNDKQIANVNFHLGRIYASTGAPEKAITHYEASLKLVPDYFVTHNALGFLHLKKCDTLGQAVTASAKAKDVTLNEKTYKAYKLQVDKTIPYFEKSQACDPDERTMNILKGLYNSTKNTTALATLPDRLASLSKECVTLLDDE